MHILITVLGTNPQELVYEMGGKEFRSSLAPLALIELLPEKQRPETVFAICTPEAKRDTLPLLMEQAPNTITVKDISVPTGDTEDDISLFMEEICKALPANQGESDCVTVDVTHGFRHLSFLTLMSVLYVSALRGLKVNGAYYAMLRREGPSPFLDLSPLLELSDWVHVLKVFQQTGNAGLLSEKVLRSSGVKPVQNCKRIAERLLRISESYLSGLPLELGMYTSLFSIEKRTPQLVKILRDELRLPLSFEVGLKLEETIGVHKLPKEVTVTGDGWKGKLTLTVEELGRQSRQIDDLLVRGDLPAAFGLMREWTVSWVMLNKGDTEGWLSREKRKKSENILGALSTLAKDSELVESLNTEQKDLGMFWKRLGDLRNSFHHHGMRSQEISRDDVVINREIEEVSGFWRNTMRHRPIGQLAVGNKPTYECLLVSPVGRMAGVLYSAVKACSPKEGGPCDACLVICSSDTKPHAQEALDKAGFKGETLYHVIKDPFAGMKEISEVAEQSRKFLVMSRRVLVNVTGGTTLMGLAADAVAYKAGRLAVPVRRFGLIDTRSTDEQRTDPFQQGVPFWLGSGEDEEG